MSAPARDQRQKRMFSTAGGDDPGAREIGGPSALRPDGDAGRFLLLLEINGVLNPFAVGTCPPGSTEHNLFPGEDPPEFRWCASISSRQADERMALTAKRCTEVAPSAGCSLPRAR
jgi:hypothetical protein